jgi:hypothetical protein
MPILHMVTPHQALDPGKDKPGAADRIPRKEPFSGMSKDRKMLDKRRMLIPGPKESGDSLLHFLHNSSQQFIRSPPIFHIIDHLVDGFAGEGAPQIAGCDQTAFRFSKGRCLMSATKVTIHGGGLPRSVFSFSSENDGAHEDAHVVDSADRSCEGKLGSRPSLPGRQDTLSRNSFHTTIDPDLRNRKAGDSATLPSCRFLALFSLYWKNQPIQK